MRLGDVAQVTDSVQNSRAAGMSGGEPAILLVIRREAGANIIETVNRIRDELLNYANLFPPVSI